jgi:hypothetical protein
MHLSPRGSAHASPAAAHTPPPVSPLRSTRSDYYSPAYSPATTPTRARTSSNAISSSRITPTYLQPTDSRTSSMLGVVKQVANSAEDSLRAAHHQQLLQADLEGALAAEKAARLELSRELSAEQDERAALARQLAGVQNSVRQARFRAGMHATVRARVQVGGWRPINHACVRACLGGGV